MIENANPLPIFLFWLLWFSFRNSGRWLVTPGDLGWETSLRFSSILQYRECLKYHFCFESLLIAPRLIGLKDIHSESTQRNLGKRRPSQWWGEVNCQKINLKNLPKPGKNRNWPKSSSHTAWKIWITRTKCFYPGLSSHTTTEVTLIQPFSSVKWMRGRKLRWFLTDLTFWEHWWWRWWQIRALVPDRADQSPVIKRTAGHHLSIM